MLHLPGVPLVIGILCLWAAAFWIADQIIERTRPDRDLATGDDCRPADLANALSHPATDSSEEQHGRS